MHNLADKLIKLLRQNKKEVKMSNKNIQSDNPNIILQLTKGSFWALSFALLSVLIFAFVIKYTSISNNAIQPINQIIKGLSILIGCFVFGKKIKTKGWLWGSVIGVLFTILAFIVFSILDGSFSFNLNLLYDTVFGAIMGSLAGIIGISLRK